MRSSLKSVSARVERLARQCGADEPPPDENNPSAYLAWAVGRYGLAAILAGADEPRARDNNAVSHPSRNAAAEPLTASKRRE